MESLINGVIIQSLHKLVDKRGWLYEFWRYDESLKQNAPMMGYASMTLPNVARGPHEHVNQTDRILFLGTSTFKVWLWDNRVSSATYGKHMVFETVNSFPMVIVIPPQVVHAYKNVGISEGIVINLPDQLFAGMNRSEPVDEIRHENNPDSQFKLV